MKQQQLSPQKYIQIKARTLPIYKCLVNSNWEDSKIANVIVMRKHTNGNVTTGFYLVDLMCLGIKDTFYFFNKPEEEVTENLTMTGEYFEEIDYNYAHNIIYAGHDFAADFEIQPHKEFAITKYILEEDDDNIPLVEVETGDAENGEPFLLVEESFNYAPILEKLRNHAGEGHYKFAIADEEENHHEDDFDEEELNENNEDFENENDFDEGNKYKNDSLLAFIEPDFLDFNHLRELDDNELEEASGYNSWTIGDDDVFHAEKMMRIFYECKPELKKDYDEIVATKEFRANKNATESHRQEYERAQSLIEKVFQEIRFLMSDTHKDAVDKTQDFFNLFEKYKDIEMGAFAVLNSMPKFHIALKLEKLKNHFNEYAPLIQLLITAFSMSIQSKLDKPDERFNFILDASSPEEAFPGNRVHAMHHKIFWVIQSLNAMYNNDEARVAHYHSLLTVTGIGGQLKQLYAIYLAEWLANR